MTTVTQKRLINPRLGTYFGIFASTFAALVLMLLILEQLGLDDGALRWLMLLGPLGLFAAIGITATCREPDDFYAAGRRVPSAYVGLVLASTAIGGTGLVAITGVFFINGFDAWCLVIGLTAGFVLMALLIAPYFRKFGAYTVPSFLGRRLDSQMVRITAAAIFAVPMLLIITAELRMGAFAAALLVHQPEALMTLLLLLTAMACVLFGGMRSLTWTNTAQSIASLLALLVPVAIVAALVTNLPLPQLSHGPVLRAIGRLEVIQAVPIAIAPSLAFDIAGQDLQPLAMRIAAPYGSIGPLSFMLACLTLAAGVAAAPWLLPRCGSTPGVFEARKSIGWATFFCGITLITASSVAVFMRDIVMDQLVGRSAEQMPVWFNELQRMGLAAVSGNMPRLPMSSFSFKRDAVLLMLPAAADFPAVLQYLALIGAVAVALAGASAAMVALGNVLVEDVLAGVQWEPVPSVVRLSLGRIAIAVVGTVAAVIALLIPADPLQLLLWGLTISASTAFPILVLSIWWKRITGRGAIVGMIAGFAVAVLAILAGETAWLGVPSALAAVFGLPAGFAAAVIATRLSPTPERQVIELVRDMRSPGGETIHDREIRLLRLKQRQRP